MKKYETIKSNTKFNEILNKGKKNQSKNFYIFFMESNNYKPKYGIAVSKKNGNAVIRNKIKRITRNIIDSNKNMFKNNQDYIIMSKSSCLLSDYEKLNEELNNLMKEINKKNENK